jgi:23S rRNA pseudouridine2605 synthase
MQKKGGNKGRKHSFGKPKKKGSVKSGVREGKTNVNKTKSFDKPKSKKKVEAKKSFDKSKRSNYKPDDINHNKSRRPSDKKGSKRKVQFLNEKEIYNRTRLDKKGFENKHADRLPTLQELDNTEIRLNKFIAMCGVCSRREADELITQGIVSVNKKEITEVGAKVKPTDRVRVDGKLLVLEEKTYILLNKPKGFITTTSDPEDRQTVLDIVAEATPNRVFPVGRLDRNTTGVLLLTNDGDFMEKVTHPKFNITKVYKVTLDRKATVEELQKLLDGVHLEDGFSRADNIALLDDTGKVVGVEIHSGKNRIIRRMFEHLGFDVKYLDRTAFGPFTKTSLRPGKFRMLNDREVALVGRLKKQKPKKKID